MDYYESDQDKLELLHHVDEVSSDYHEERNDLPVLEAKHMRQNILDRALRYTEGLKWTTIQPRKSYPIIAICLLALITSLGLIFGSRQTLSTATETAITHATTLPLTYNRILSASMLFGITSPTYKRAIETHKRQAQRWGYATEILQRHEGCGFWTKLIFLLNLVGQEMQKPADIRAERIMWADADALILNPNIPLSIFLPPPDLPHIHFVGNKDWNGLNNGVFFIRVHPWTVSMFTSAMSFPTCHKDVNLGANVEQEAMRLTFERENGSKGDKGWQSGIVFMPRKWFNAYELFQNEIQGSDYYKETINSSISSYPGLGMTHKYKGARGTMLAHSPGIKGDVRQELEPSDMSDNVISFDSLLHICGKSESTNILCSSQTDSE